MTDSPIFDKALVTLCDVEDLLRSLDTRAKIVVETGKLTVHIPYEDDDVVYDKLVDAFKYFGSAGVRYQVFDDLLLWQCRWPWRRIQLVDRRIV